jgi:oligoendopeptidase F
MPHKNYDNMVFAKDGGIWQGQLHIYQMPFYYIDYTLAQTCAFQFWIKNEKDKKAAWNDYLRLCRAGGSLSFTKLVELAKLKSPFKDGCLEEVVDYANKWLKTFDVKNM